MRSNGYDTNKQYGNSVISTWVWAGDSWLLSDVPNFYWNFKCTFSLASVCLVNCVTWCAKKRTDTTTFLEWCQLSANSSCLGTRRQLRNGWEEGLHLKRECLRKGNFVLHLWTPCAMHNCKISLSVHSRLYPQNVFFHEDRGVVQDPFKGVMQPRLWNWWGAGLGIDEKF